MRRPVILSSLVMASIAAGPANGQPLYLGTQEIDTADRQAIAAVIERCTELAQEAQDAATVTRFTTQHALAAPTPDGEAVQQQGSPAPLEPAPAPDQGTATQAPTPAAPDTDTADGGMPLSLGVDAVASSGEGAEPEGEGAGEGAEPAGEGGGQGQDSSSGQQGGDGPDLAAITLEDCKQAGLVF